MLPFVALFGVIVILIGIYLARVPAYNAQDFVALQKSSFAPFLKDLAFKWHAGRGAARPRADHRVLLRGLPAAIRGGEPQSISPVLHRLAAGGARLQAGVALRVGPLSTVVGHVRPSRSRRRSCAAWASGRCCRWTACGLPVPRSKAFRCAVFLLDALLLTAAIVATRVSFQMMNLVASTRSKQSRRILVYGAGGYGRLLVRECAPTRPGG